VYLDEAVPDRIKILDAEELLDLFKQECPSTLRKDDPTAKITIGFVGYPNVGKSSTLNALVGAHKVAVGATPGKTKHFQTIHLPDMILCDCPGLVFPSFATTKAEMVCNGILPIDQLREYIGPMSLVAQRIPKVLIEAIYGIRISTRDDEGRHQDRQPTAYEVLSAYAIARGFTKSSQGNPDEARAARHLLKDYVKGKLLFVHPPPMEMDAVEFNQELYNNERYIKRKVKEASQHASSETPSSVSAKDPRSLASMEPVTPVDVAFFTETLVKAKTVGKFASSDFTSRVTATPSTPTTLPPKKSHKKGKKNVKIRTEWTATP